MALQKCPECGKNISNTCKFCIHCGYKLKKEDIKIKCPECGEEVSGSRKFCTNCGYDLQKENIDVVEHEDTSSEQSSSIDKMVFNLILFTLIPSTIIFAIFKVYSYILVPIYLLIVYRKTKIAQQIISIISLVSKKILKYSSNIAKKVLSYLVKYKKTTMQVAVAILLIAVSIPLYYKFFRYGHVFEAISPKEESSVRFREGNYKWGKLDGLVKNYNEKKQLISEVIYKNGKRDGKTTIFYPKDNPDERVINCTLNLKDNQLDGENICYYENGEKLEETTYKTGKREGLAISYYENGGKKLEGIYVNDKIDGNAITYYKNGQKASDTFFKNGEKEGSYISYYENGQKKVEGTYKNGKEDGNWISYFKNGEVKAECGKKDGNWDGLCKFYYENGKLKAEYEISNGYYDNYIVFYTPDGNKKIEAKLDNQELAEVVIIGKESFNIRLDRELSKEKIGVFMELLNKDVIPLHYGSETDDKVTYLWYRGSNKNIEDLSVILDDIKKIYRKYKLYDQKEATEYSYILGTNMDTRPLKFSHELGKIVERDLFVCSPCESNKHLMVDSDAKNIEERSSLERYLSKQTNGCKDCSVTKNEIAKLQELMKEPKRYVRPETDAYRSNQSTTNVFTCQHNKSGAFPNLPAKYNTCLCKQIAYFVENKDYQEHVLYCAKLQDFDGCIRKRLKNSDWLEEVYQECEEIKSMGGATYEESLKKMGISLREK